MGLWNALKRMFAGRGPKFISEEQAIADDMERLDREVPGWDREGEARLIGAQRALEIGLSRATCLTIYGAELVQEAERYIKEGRCIACEAKNARDGEVADGTCHCDRRGR